MEGPRAAARVGRVAVIGAGPAGLTAAYVLTKEGARDVTVLEADPRYVGGMHRYNNQDHAMMTAMLAARNILAGERLYDVWRVNQDAAYHESGTAGAQGGMSGLRAVPRRIGVSG